jgi:hypothetical protein
MIDEELLMSRVPLSAVLERALEGHLERVNKF